jgi:copper transport protein
VVISTTPTDGARLANAPAAVSVKFDEPVGLDLGYLRVVDSAGRRVDAGNPTHPNGDGTQISVALKSGLGDGRYLASWRVVSADSHPVAGTFRFVVGSGPLTAGPGTSSGGSTVNRGVSTALAVSHWLSFAGVGVVGGSWLIFTIWPAGRRRVSVRRTIWAGWGLAAAGAITEYLLQGPYDAGSSLATILQSNLLDATLHVNSGELLSLRLLLLGVLGLVLTALLGNTVDRPSWAPEAAAIVGAGIVVTFAATGHSQSTNPRWLAVTIDALHMTAMIVWLGGLAILVASTMSSRDPETEDDSVELAAGMPIFSRVALTAVATLAVTGTFQAWREVGAWAALTATTYGRLVLIKVLLLGVLICTGYLARRVVLRRDWAGGNGTSLLSPVQRLRRTLVVEVIVGAVVLAATGVLISQPPGKVALAAQQSKPASATVSVTADSKARVVITPGKHGTVQVDVSLTGSVTPVAVSGTASLPSKSLGPITLPLQAAGPRLYSATGVLLPSAGDWQIDVTVQTSQFDSTTGQATIHLN